MNADGMDADGPNMQSFVIAVLERKLWLGIYLIVACTTVL